MKNKLIAFLFLMSLPTLLATSTKEVKAEESTLNNYIYEEDFESLGVGDNGDAVYNSKKLFWFESGVTPSIIESNGSKALEYKINNNNEYTVFGGIGTGAIDNLAKLVSGEKYVFSVDLNMQGTTASSELFIEYQVNSWTGIKVSNSGVSILNDQTTFNAKYENGKLSFTFIGGKLESNNGWIKITAHNYTSESSVIFDNLSIEKETLDVFDYDMNFENLAIGTSAPANNLSNIPNIYNGTNELSIAINGSESNHYIEVSKNGTGSDVWDKFYINGLNKLVSDTNYRITMDILETNCTEFYICYNEGGQPCVTYNPSGYVGKDTNEFILGGSFDGKHLTFDFKPSTSKDANWWQQVASKVVTAIDDGTIPNGWGSNNIDDEGNKTNRTVLIKNGILTNYLIDDFNGRRMGMKGNGASRRQSYAFEPTSRMSNTYIAAGKSSVDEMIKSVKLGLYAKSLGGGSVNPTTGDFNFAVDEAYMIRDGKVAEMVKGATLIGNGADILMKIDMVGSDVKRAQGMCGAASGSCPVDVGQPTIRVSEITVGGRGGALK